MKTEKIQIRIEGMHCASCAAKVKSTLKKSKEIKDANVNALTKIALVEYESGKIDASKILKMIKGLGYKPFLEANEAEGLSTDPVCGMKIEKNKSIKKEF